MTLRSLHKDRFVMNVLKDMDRIKMVFAIDVQRLKNGKIAIHAWLMMITFL